MQSNNDFLASIITNGVVAAVTELMLNSKFEQIAMGIGQNIWNSIFKGLEKDLDVRDKFICRLSRYPGLHAAFIVAEAFPRFSPKTNFDADHIDISNICRLSKLDKRFWTKTISKNGSPWLVHWSFNKNASNRFRELIKLFTVEELDAYVYNEWPLLRWADDVQFIDLLEKGVTNADPSELSKTERKLLEEKLRAKQPTQPKQSLAAALKTVLGDEYGALVFEQVFKLMN
jgi:hypothetical protein